MVFRDISAKTRRSCWLHFFLSQSDELVTFSIRSDVNAFHLVGNTNKKLVELPVKCRLYLVHACFSPRRLPDFQSMCFILPFSFRSVQSPVTISGRGLRWCSCLCNSAGGFYCTCSDCGHGCCTDLGINFVNNNNNNNNNNNLKKTR